MKLILGQSQTSYTTTLKQNYIPNFLSFENGARLEIMWRPNISERLDKVMNEGLIHFAFSVGSKEAVDTLTQKIIVAGYKCFSAPRTTGDGYYESVILDPDGNMIEITV